VTSSGKIKFSTKLSTKNPAKVTEELGIPIRHSAYMIP